jgi:enoyl-CoA hydratase
LQDCLFFKLEDHELALVLRLESCDGTNRLTRACVLALNDAFNDFACAPRPVIITGNEKFFSAGADLNEIGALTAPEGYEFSLLGQNLMNTIERFPALVCAAISGYCMGGGLDLAMACHRRIAAPSAIFGHRGAALGLITGWGGTQRLPRLIGKAKALEMFVTARKLDAREALRIGLVDAVSDNSVAETMARLTQSD